MARYAIGDIQGCYEAFSELLAKINFHSSTDILYLVGDLVNRGPQSLKVLKWVYKHQDSVITVLGNHDIYLLARYNQLIHPDLNETIGDILADPNASKLIDYLRHCPLIYHDSDYILSHAGIYPLLNFNYLLKINHAISNHLICDDYKNFLLAIYGNKPNCWDKQLNLIQQMKFVINACTRMRFLNKNNFSLEYKFKKGLADRPDNLIPWFNIDFDSTINKTIIFGHWASLGLYQTEKCICLDTGCVWGRTLTAYNLDTHEVIQVKNSEAKSFV